MALEKMKDVRIRISQEKMEDVRIRINRDMGNWINVAFYSLVSGNLTSTMSHEIIMKLWEQSQIKLREPINR